MGGRESRPYSRLPSVLLVVGGLLSAIGTVDPLDAFYGDPVLGSATRWTVVMVAAAALSLAAAVCAFRISPVPLAVLFSVSAILALPSANVEAQGPGTLMVAVPLTVAAMIWALGLAAHWFGGSSARNGR